MYIIQHTKRESNRRENLLNQNTIDDGQQRTAKTLGPFNTVGEVMVYLDKQGVRFPGGDTTAVVNALELMASEDYNKANDTLAIDWEANMNEVLVMNFEHTNEDAESMERVRHTRLVNHIFSITVLQRPPN